ncbi:hypothetical protein [Amycolatopsis sp. YIM 10]|uniref:hypothetical protein n=1 Tax=Amycolatopsis sp. YIM 10 TaxID=2653857 RepID=UPI0012900D47|nr:hypothetical protein [Amycolatopsis sp. YIM 10]QFU90950.1 hypothetical protein YIM_28890 [Amycolatopsis sp. YIM 10]
MSKSESKPGAWSSAGLWLPGLIVAISAAVATAHGLYEVVRVSGVPGSVAWTYPLITDGLAIVAYAATSRLTKGRGYAWAVVILAAGLSGLAQAMYFVGDFTTAVPAGATASAGVGNPPPDVLRFGVGAWPAIAAAIVAHLLFMLSSERPSARKPSTALSDTAGSPLNFAAGRAAGVSPESTVQAEAVQSSSLARPGVQSSRVQPESVQPKPLDATPASSTAERPVASVSPVQPEQPPIVEPEPGKPDRPAPSPKRDRALREARKYQALVGCLPTVDQLAETADVSRGTAGTVLKELREQPTHLHVITDISTTKANS